MSRKNKTESVCSDHSEEVARESLRKIKNEESYLWEFGKNIPPFPDDLPEPLLSSTGEYIARNNYLRRNSKGEVIESPKEMFWRVAHNIAAADLLYSSEDIDKTRKEFYEILVSLDFIPNTPTLANAASEIQQLSACFVLPVEDDLESIGQTLTHAILVHKTGGGTGFSFSKLRPRGSIVRSTGRESSGALYFMWMYADVTDRIQQGGYRRGANMGVMTVNHPDILRWITVKSSEYTVNSFNLSVALNHKFMSQVEKDGKFAPQGLAPQKENIDRIIAEIQQALDGPGVYSDKIGEFEKKIEELKELLEAKEPGEGYELINPDTGKVECRLNARNVFELIGRVAWEKGDPGVIFLNRINEDNPTPLLGEIEATNPCGEQPLLPYESCNLGAINLSRMVIEKENGFGEIDYKKIRTIVHKAVRFLDNVIDMNRYPLAEIEQMTKGNRKIGLGIMGWADMLIQLGIPYNSPKALNIAKKLMRFIRDEARKASMKLAEERGVFPNFKGSIYDKEGPRFKGENLKLRNATLTTIAPTGTTSMLADTSSGIEPLFAIFYEKHIVNGGKTVNLNPFFVKMAKKDGFWKDDLVEKIRENKGSLRGIKEIPENIQRLFPVASDISYETHIKMQSAFQNSGVDNAVSKTINMPMNATPEDVIKSYLLAHKERCKGVTIYRDRSRKKQILERGTKVEGKGTLYLRKLPVVRRGGTWGIDTPVGTLHATINEDEEGRPLETFFNVGKAGGDILAMAEAIGRLISLDLRTTNPDLATQKLKLIIEQLTRIGGSVSIGFGSHKVLSLPDGIAKALQNYLDSKEGKGEVKKTNNPSSGNKATFGDICPKCGNATLVHEEGCNKCMCGYSTC